VSFLSSKPHTFLRPKKGNSKVNKKGRKKEREGGRKKGRKEGKKSQNATEREHIVPALTLTNYNF